MNNPNPPGQFSNKTARNMTFQMPRQANHYFAGLKPASSEEAKPQELISTPAPYSMPTTSAPQAVVGASFVGPCFVCQPVSFFSLNIYLRPIQAYIIEYLIHKKQRVIFYNLRTKSFKISCS